MSYLCSVGYFEGTSDITIAEKQDLIDMLDSDGVFIPCELDAESLFDEFSACEDDPTGVIYDWAKKHKISMSYVFNPDLDDGNSIRITFKDGIEVEEEDLECNPYDY